MKQMLEVVATTPSKPLGACAEVTVDILPHSSCGMRWGRTEGARGVHVSTNFYTPNSSTFQTGGPSRSALGIHHSVPACLMSSVQPALNSGLQLDAGC